MNIQAGPPPANNSSNSIHSGYCLARLPAGGYSIRDLEVGETFHPVIGPEAEAQALYVSQLGIPSRIQGANTEFVVWDIGLGAAANAIAVIRAARNCSVTLRISSFDRTLEPLKFGIENADRLGYFHGLEPHIHALIKERRASFVHGKLSVEWEALLGDFPSLLQRDAAELWPKPHAILHDAYSPMRNPAMWTLPLFERINRLLSPERGCALATYSRSTMLRVTLLCAGFFVGAGHATGQKEETTIAANTPALVAAPLDRRWLMRARRSSSAQPLGKPVYRQQRLSEEMWDKLLRHPQFQGV